MFNVEKIIVNLRAKLDRQLAAVEATESHIRFLTTDSDEVKVAAEIEDSKTASGKPSRK